MRTLLLMQGAPGSGKSYWIKENNLEQYTLSADNIRTMLSSPILNENGKMTITQKNDKYVWDLLFQILENRMKNGDFTVIDATHNNDKTIKKYKELCDTYKYTMFIKRVDTPLEQCLINNRNRDKYKFVPEDKIKLIYNRIQNMKKLSWFNYINDISEINNFYIEDMDKYNEVFVIGDIHGCIEPLNDFFKQHSFNENSAYIFLGDYIDRGLNNLEVMKKMTELSQYTNVFLLEGNHENVLLPFSKGIPSGKTAFDKYTAPELKSIPKKDIKLFYKKLRQCMRIRYRGYEYLLTHGGLPCNPKHLTYISTHQLIKGVGDYDSDIDRSWLENESTVIQIHGHRSYKNYPNSCSLENEVEFGGWLNYAELSDNGFTIYSIKNNKFKQTTDNAADTENRKGLNTPNKTINDMSRNRMIKCKKLDNNIVSINFSKSCFKKKAWNDLTVKARGLFVNKETGDIIGRGYEKFFNFRERQDTTLKYIEDNYQFPLYCYKKYNGYLGIISHNNGELIFFSKTTNVGEKAERFKEIFYKYTTNSFRETLLNILIQYNCSLTCEVVDILYDPHIISSDINESIHMLDLIENTLEYNNLEDIFKKEITSRLLANYDYHREHISAKELCNIIADKNDLKDWIKKAKSEVDSEGYVIQSCDNKQIFKLKTDYYNEWKSCRYLMNRIQKQNGYFEIRLSQSPLQVQFGKWYSDNFDTLKDIGDIISLRNRFENYTKVLK